MIVTVIMMKEVMKMFHKDFMSLQDWMNIWGYEFNVIQIYKCNKLRQNPTIGVDEQLGLCKQDSHLSVARQYDCTKVKS